MAFGGLFGGGSKGGGSKEPSTPKQSTADSIEMADGTVYERRKAAESIAATPAIADPMGMAKKQNGTMSTDPLDSMMARSKKKSNATIAGANSYGFG